MENIDLEVTPGELQYILQVLGTRPLNEVSELYSKIQGQAASHVTGEVPEPPTPKK